MLPVALQSLALASGGLVSVGSITLMILLLISDYGWRNGLGYLLGYIGAYTLIGLTVVSLGYQYSEQAEPANGTNPLSSVPYIVMGVLLLWLTVRNWRKTPPDPEEEQTPSRLFAIVDKITPLRAFVFGLIISVINVKNLAIFMSAISIVLESNLLLMNRLLIVLLDVIVFCTSLIVPLGIYLLFPASAYERLTAFKRLLERYSRPIGIWIPLIFGLIFLIRGVRDFL